MAHDQDGDSAALRDAALHRFYGNLTPDVGLNDTPAGGNPESAVAMAIAERASFDPSDDGWTADAIEWHNFWSDADDE
jgi:hypothetical protein